MNTFTVEVTQVDREAAVDIYNVILHDWHTQHMLDGMEDECYVIQAFARHRITSQPDDLAAASQLEHSGLISREKYNHIVENIRARDAVRSAMA